MADQLCHIWVIRVDLGVCAHLSSLLVVVCQDEDGTCAHHCHRLGKQSIQARCVVRTHSLAPALLFELQSRHVQHTSETTDQAGKKPVESVRTGVSIELRRLVEYGDRFATDCLRSEK